MLPFVWLIIKKVEHMEYDRFVKDLEKAQQIADGKILVSKKELDKLCSKIKLKLYVHQYDTKYMNKESAEIFSQVCSL